MLAGLAWRLGRDGEAAAHARAGLALESRVGSRIWVKRTEDLLHGTGSGDTPGGR